MRSRETDGRLGKLRKIANGLDCAEKYGVCRGVREATPTPVPLLPLLL